MRLLCVFTPCKQLFLMAFRCGFVDSKLGACASNSVCCCWIQSQIFAGKKSVAISANYTNKSIIHSAINFRHQLTTAIAVSLSISFALFLFFLFYPHNIAIWKPRVCGFYAYVLFSSCFLSGCWLTLDGHLFAHMLTATLTLLTFVIIVGFSSAHGFIWCDSCTVLFVHKVFDCNINCWKSHQSTHVMSTALTTD